MKYKYIKLLKTEDNVQLSVKTLHRFNCILF